MADSLKKGKVQNLSVAITFDDGYADALHEAKSILERFETPATVYVSSGFVGTNKEFFWDELDRIFLQPSQLPRNLQVEVDGKPFASDMGEWTHYSASDFEKFRAWNVTMQEAPTPRHEAYRSLCSLLHPLSHEKREATLRSLRGWAELPESGRHTHLPLNVAEVRNLAQGTVVEAGAHTRNHVALSSLPRGIQRAEIEQSKMQLEEWTGKQVLSFSYPFGRKVDYTAETISLVRECGFQCACSNYPDSIRRGTDPFQLPRVLVRDWTGAEFERRLDNWFANWFA